MPQRRTVGLSVATALVVSGWLGLAAVQPGFEEEDVGLRTFAGCAELGPYVRQRAVESATATLQGLTDKYGRLGHDLPSHPYASSPPNVRVLPEPEETQAPTSLVYPGRLVTLEVGRGDLRLFDISGDRPVARGRLTLRDGEHATGLFRLPGRRVLVVSDADGSAAFTLVRLTDGGPEVVRRAELGGSLLALRRSGGTIRAVLDARSPWRAPRPRPGASLLGTIRDIAAAADGAAATAFLPTLRIIDGRGHVERDRPLVPCSRTFAVGRYGGPHLTAVLDVDSRRGDGMLTGIRATGLLTLDGVLHAPPGRIHFAVNGAWDRHGIAVHAVDSTRGSHLGTREIVGDDVQDLVAGGTRLAVVTTEYKGRCSCEEALLTMLDERGGLAPVAAPYRFGERRQVGALEGTGTVLTTATFKEGEGRWNVRLDVSDPNHVAVTRTLDTSPATDPLRYLLDDLKAGGTPEAVGPGWQAARRESLVFLPAGRTAVLRSYETREVTRGQCRRVPACEPWRTAYDLDVALAVRAGSDGRLRLVGRFAGDPEIRTVLRAGSRLVAVTPRSVSLLAPGDLRVRGILRLAPDRTRPALGRPE